MQSGLAIMWSTMMPDKDTEPLELRILKRQLANLNCKCTACRRPRHEHRRNSRDDKEIQAELYDDFDESPTLSSKNICSSPFRNDILCPSCCITMKLLRGSFVRVLKDEESETKVRVANKSSGTAYKCVEKSTSVTSKPFIQISTLTLTDYMSEYSSDLTVAKQSRKRSHDRVTFVNIAHEPPERDTKKPAYGNCSCLENFIESIRPPMIDNIGLR